MTDDYVIGLGEAMERNLIRYPVVTSDISSEPYGWNKIYSIQGFPVLHLEEWCMNMYQLKGKCHHSSSNKICDGCAIPTLIKDIGK
jgi:hypothetical protein